jgi:hypothetical protein
MMLQPIYAEAIHMRHRGSSPTKTRSPPALSRRQREIQVRQLLQVVNFLMTLPLKEVMAVTERFHQGELSLEDMVALATSGGKRGRGRPKGSTTWITRVDRDWKIIQAFLDVEERRPHLSERSASEIVAKKLGLDAETLRVQYRRALKIRGCLPGRRPRP